MAYPELLLEGCAGDEWPLQRRHHGNKRLNELERAALESKVRGVQYAVEDAYARTSKDRVVCPS